MKIAAHLDPTLLRRGQRVLFLRVHTWAGDPPQWSQGVIHSVVIEGWAVEYKVQSGGKAYPTRRAEISLDHGFRLGDPVMYLWSRSTGKPGDEYGKVVRMFSLGEIEIEFADGSRVRAPAGEMRHESRFTAVRRWFLKKWGV